MIQKWKSKNHYWLEKAKYKTLDSWLDLRAKIEDPGIHERRRRRFLEKQKAIERDKKINKNDFLP